MDLKDRKGTVQLFSSCAHVIEQDDSLGREVVFGNCPDGEPHTLNELVPYLQRGGYDRRTIRSVEEYKFS